MAKNQEISISYPGGLPLPKQRIAHLDKESRDKGVEGGFASGKSYWLVFETAIQLVTYPGNDGLYGRLTNDEIRRTFFPIWEEIMPKELILSHNKNEQCITVRTSGEEPSRLWYMSLDESKGAIDKIKSMNLGFAAIDQMEEISENIYYAIKGRLRNKKGRRQFFFNCNPEGHDWVWRHFIKPNRGFANSKMFFMNAWQEGIDPPSKEEIDSVIAKTKKDKTDLILKDFPKYLKYTDNPYLPLDYLLDMMDKPEQWKKRYLFGKRDAFEGLVYSEFDEKVHIIPPFNTDRDYVRVVSMDYGKQNPTAIYFWDIDKEGRVFCVDEIYQQGLDIPTIKTLIRAKNRDREVDAWIADGSIYDERIQGMESVGQLFNNNEDVSGWSINWKAADRSRGSVAAGIEIVQQYLKHDKFTDNKAKVYFFEGRCPALIEEIMDYRWKELSTAKDKNQPDMPRKVNDHAMDSMRYALAHIKRYGLRYKPNTRRGLSQFLREYKRGIHSDVRGFMVK